MDTVKNPVAPVGNDPWVIWKDGWYYYCYSWDGIIRVHQARKLQAALQFEGKRSMISTPERDWELNAWPLINEGPTVLKNRDRVFIIYSASGSWANNYCLGQLTLTGDDPMAPHSWVKKPVPVLLGTTNVISPDHASFTRSPDGTENWIVYHAARKRDGGWDRNTRVQRFTWDAQGNPVFGEPVPEDVALPAPSDKPAP